MQFIRLIGLKSLPDDGLLHLGIRTKKEELAPQGTKALE